MAEKKTDDGSARHDEPAPVADPVAVAREAELELQRRVNQAVWDAAHNPDGTPKPIVVR